MCDRCRGVVQAGVARRFPGARDALLFVPIRALYCASLQCVWCRTRRREDELKCGRFLGGGRITVILHVITIFILQCASRQPYKIKRRMILVPRSIATYHAMSHRITPKHQAKTTSTKPTTLLRSTICFWLMVCVLFLACLPSGLV